jgi:Family of unknown function (DUF6159)
MRRFKLGFKLAGQSWRVLRGHPALLSFPLVGALFAVVLVGPPAGVGAWLLDRGDTVPGIAVLVVALYLISFITAFMAVGLVAAADAVMRGEDASFGYGMRIASSHLAAVSGWALINAALSLVLGALESRGAGGEIAAGLVGGAWTVVSLLAIPAIALEDAGPFQAIRRSASIFRQQWGGQVVGMAAIGIAVFIVGILPALLIIAVGVGILSGGGGPGFAAGEIVLGGRHRGVRGRHPCLHGATPGVRRRALPLRDDRQRAHRLRRVRPEVGGACSRWRNRCRRMNLPCGPEPRPATNLH